MPSKPIFQNACRNFLAFAIGLVLTLGASSALSRAAQNKQTETFKTFADWCKNQEQLDAEASKTVDLLLDVAGTKDCILAGQNLSRRTKLELQFSEIEDVGPLSSLTQLVELNLSNNDIEDVSPLANLTNLTALLLLKNEIEDIAPLGNLANLKTLNLAGNEIVDIKPLARLTKLRELFLMGNQITDIRPLSSLENLVRLWLGGNPIADPTCPVPGNSVCLF